MAPERRIPDLILERYALGELSPGEHEEVRRALEKSDELRMRLAALNESNEAILAQYPARPMTAGISERAAGHPAPRSRWQPAWLGLPVAAAVAVLLWVALPGETVKRTVPGKAAGETRQELAKKTRPEPRQLEKTRVKGDPTLMVFLQDGSEGIPLEDGDIVREGDVIQLKYLANGASHGTIVSVDGRATVTLHFPPSPMESTALDQRGARALPRSYELDDAPEFERFFLVVSERPVPVAEILAAVQGAGSLEVNRLELDASLRQLPFTLTKAGEEVEP